MDRSTGASEKKNFFSNLPEVEGKFFPIIIPVFTLLLFTGLVFGVYSDTLESPFTFDDAESIERNTHIRVTQFSLKEIVGAGLKSSKSRFIAYISFALNYYFHQYDLIGYHIVNNIVHILSGFFLYLFITATLKTSALSSRFDHPDLIAFLAALLWLIHPVQTQSVTYIVQRMTSMASMFFILSLWCYVKARGVESGRAKWLWFTGSALAWLLSLGCKEVTVTLPIFVFLYDWYFFQELDKKWIKRRLPFVLGIVAVLAVVALAYTDFQPLEKLSNLRDYKENQFTMAQRVLTQTRVVIHYISLLTFPHPSRLNLDYDFALSYSLMNPFTTLLSLTAILGLIAIGVYLAKRDRLISFCIFWFFGNLVIESSVVPLAIIFEHRLYLPSMLFFLVPVLLGYRYVKLIWIRAALTGLLCLVLVVFSVWTYQRNRVWETDITLWTDVVSKSPQKARPHLNLGLALAKRSRIDEAIKHYRISLQLNPNNPEVHNNLGAALKDKGRINAAIQHYRKALQLDPNYAAAINNLAEVLKMQGRPQVAEKYYRGALRIDPDNDTLHNNLGHVLVAQGKINQAVEHYRKALQLNPNSAKAHFGWGDALAKQGKAEQAIDHYKKALQINPDYAEAHSNLGGELLRQGRADEAYTHITAALDLDPQLAEAHSNMGVLLIQKGKIEVAISHLREALRLKPDFSLAAENLQQALAIQKDLEERTMRIQAALKTEPDNPLLYFEMGNIFFARGEFSKAVAEYDKALSIHPRFPEAQYNSALAYAAGKKYDRALESFKKMLAIQPDNPNTYYNIAAMYALQNQVDDSIDWLKKAIARGYQNWQLIKTDKDLENIRSSAAYKDLVKNR